MGARVVAKSSSERKRAHVVVNNPDAAPVNRKQRRARDKLMKKEKKAGTNEL